MDFLTIQNDVKGSRFEETHRALIKRWINYRYGRIWSSEPWTFKITFVPVTIPANAQSVTLANEGIQRIHALYNGTITPGFSGLDPFRPEDYHRYATSTSTIPAGFSVAGDTIYLDRTALSQQNLTAVAETKWTELVNDGDEPLFPDEFHYILVPAAASHGMRLHGDPRWEAEEADVQAGLSDMKAAYLTSVRNYGDHYPSWP